MFIQALHKNFIMPTKATEGSAAYDIYMPEDGIILPNSQRASVINLGFAMAIPKGFCGLLLPRSSTGAKSGLALNNTVGVIDSDYRGEWQAYLRVHNAEPFRWKRGDRVLQLLIVPIADFELIQTESLDITDRVAGFGSTGI